MIKNVIIVVLSLSLLVVLLLDSDFLSARIRLLQNSKQEFIQDEFMCGDFAKRATEVLKDKNIKSYAGIVRERGGFHAFTLIAFNPENNRFYSLDELGALVDVCDIDETRPVCIKGELNKELNYYEQ